MNNPSPERIEGTKTLVRKAVAFFNETLRLAALDGLTPPIVLQPGDVKARLAEVQLDETAEWK